MQPLRKLADQVIVITGASSGVGRATAFAAARRGAHVALTARSAEALASLRREIERVGGTALDAPADVTDERQMGTVAERAVATFGGIAIRREQRRRHSLRHGRGGG